MTLNIKDVEIAGLPAVQVRNMLRRADHRFTRTLVEDHFEVSASRANKIIQALSTDGYIESAAGCYELTIKGEKLTQASAMGKIPRERAERIVAGLAKRVDEVNGNPDYVYGVSDAVVFGSYVRREPFLGDVDIAERLERRAKDQNEHERCEKARIAVAHENGRRFQNFVDQLFWPEHEVFLYLKARTRGLSLHSFDEFIRCMRKDKKFAYEVLRGPAAKIAGQEAA